MQRGEATYHATFEFDPEGRAPEGEWWVTVDEFPGICTSARTLGKAREYLIDALAGPLHTPAHLLRDRVVFHPPNLPRPAHEAVSLALAEREIAEAVRGIAAESTRRAAVELVEGAHLSLRDAAEILGLSHQRVQQLVTARRSTKPLPPDPPGAPEEALAQAVRHYRRSRPQRDLGDVAAFMAGTLGTVSAELA